MIRLLRAMQRWQHEFDLPIRVCQGLAAVALAVEVAGTLMAWSTFSGFPGLMTLTLYPAGARIYVLALALGLLLPFVNFSRRRQAGLWCTVGGFAVTLQTILAISKTGGGLVNVAGGAYVTLIGTIVGMLALVALPDDGAALPSSWPKLPAGVEAVGIIAASGAFLALFVYALDVNAANQFLALLILIAAAVGTLNRLGLFDYTSQLFARRHRLSLALMGLMALGFPFTQDGSSYWLRVAANVGVLAVAAIGLNVVVGLAGLLDLGYIAFFGIGAYVAALYGNPGLGPGRGHIPFILVVPLGALVAGLIGVIIGAPTLRLRGDYLAIVTLGFGEIFRIVVNTYDGFTGGPNGLAAIPDLSIGSFNLGNKHTWLGVSLNGFANYYWIELFLIVVVMLLFSRLDNSRIGRAWVAIREDELAAQAMGINTVSYKLLAFGIGASIAGASGTVQAHVATQVSPDSFIFMQSVLLLAAVVLGGMGTVPGALVGAAVLYAVPEKLRAFSDYRLLIFGVLLILVMRFRPEGMIPSKRRQREFHEDPQAEGQAVPV